MAVIQTRYLKNGEPVYSVIIRRKDVPTFTMTFDDMDEAKKWIQDHEKRYIDNPYPYIEWKESVSLKRRRDREFR